MTRLTISSGLPTTVLTLAAAIGLMTTAVAGQIPFDGWRGLRVIPLDGRAERLLVADLGGDGR